MVGDLLKYRYRILEKEADDDLFSVYKCDDVIGKRTVTAKILLPQYTSSRVFIDQILKDAQSLEDVMHPGIIRVFDHGEENGKVFIITENINGISLDSHIRKSAPYPIPTVLDIASAICSVIDYMQNQGFVHGDLRPANILVTPEGQIKVANFWLSKAASFSQTIRTNLLMRSVHYMSPETAGGQPASAASDIYSLGVIIFQLLSGRLPYEGDTPNSIARKHADDSIPNIRALTPGISKGLESIILKALQKIPASRYRSAKDMLNALANEKNPKRTNLTSGNTIAPKVEPEDDSEEYEYVTDPPALLVIRKVLLIFVLIIIIAAAGISTYFYTKPADIITPDLIGKTAIEAQGIAAQAGLSITTNMEQYNEKFPEGTIYFTDPLAGRMIKKGKEIEIWISKGSRYALVPNLNGIPLEDAQKNIIQAGLSVGEVTDEYSDKIPMGNVIKQKPASGIKLDRDSKVDLTYSLGPKTEDETSSTIEETPSSNDGSSQSSGQPRSFDVKFKVPPGPDQQNVEIAVVDDYGENIVYTEVKRPGESVEQTVEGVGSKIKLRIYIDGKLVKEERK
ncbi:MAG: protein kinase domain-containing protein [Armatimonadota bacterium]